MQVKCDERPGGCDNCSRLNLNCIISASSPQVQRGESRTAKVKRTYRSCIACRTAKAKCCGSRPECHRCQQKQTNCVYEDNTQPRWADILTRATDSRQGGPSWSPVQTRGVSMVSSPEPSRAQRALTPQRVEKSSPLDWLKAPSLPEDPVKIGLLVQEYFSNISPLRCFAFIHQPSFLQRLDDGLASESQRHALLQVICALGAQ